MKLPPPSGQSPARYPAAVRNLLLALTLALVLALAASSSPAPARAVPARSVPPECVHTVITDDSGAGPRLYVEWCGTGAAGESPMLPAARSLIVDGARLNAGCTRARPCIILWPASPSS